MSELKTFVLKNHLTLLTDIKRQDVIDKLIEHYESNDADQAVWALVAEVRRLRAATPHSAAGEGET